MKHHLHAAVKGGAARRFQRCAIQPDRAAADRGQTADRPQDGGFARPAFADDAIAFALFYRQRHATHRPHAVGNRAKRNIQT